MKYGKDMSGVEIQFMFQRSIDKIDPERSPPPCRNFSRVASLAFHFHLICHKPLYISDPISIIALPCQSVSPSLLSLNFVPMGLVGLVSGVEIQFMFHRSNGKIDPERAPPPCRNFTRVVSLAFHFVFCIKPE